MQATQQVIKRIVATLMYLFLLTGCDWAYYPTCTIISPENGTSITRGESINIEIQADDDDRTIMLVQCFENNNLLFETTDSPYRFEWETNKYSPGEYTIKAIATDNDGYQKTDEITVTIDENANSITIEYVSVNAGTFIMGSSKSPGTANYPAHQVSLGGFYISKYEVTRAQFLEFINSINCNSNGEYNDPQFGLVPYIHLSSNNIQYSTTLKQFYFRENTGDITKYPMIYVSWHGANAFCKWAGGRLPTNAEWEFAARGGNLSNGYTYSGGNDIDQVGWIVTNSNQTCHPVGMLLPNELGIFDMTGNVNEWCSDWYTWGYNSEPVVNPLGPVSGNNKVIRGSGWGSFNNNQQCAVPESRSDQNPTTSSASLGFRIVRDLDE